MNFRSKEFPRFLALAFIFFASALTAISSAQGADRPHFRNGLWRFERTVEYVRSPPNANVVLVKETATRCVDPNVAMAGIFASPDIGTCRSEMPQVFGNQYIFPNRCDFMGPVRTLITAESEIAYTESDLLRVGPLPRRDMVVARRVGDCEAAKPQSFAADSRSPDRKVR